MLCLQDPRLHLQWSGTRCGLRTFEQTAHVNDPGSFDNEQTTQDIGAVTGLAVGFAAADLTDGSGYRFQTSSR